MTRSELIRLGGVCLALAFAAAAAGCYGGKDLTYGRIQSAYAGRNCPGGGDATPSEDPATCLPPGGLSISGAISIALRNSPDSRVAAARLRQAAAALEKSSAAFYPSMGVYTEYMRGDAPSANFFKLLDQRQVPQELNFNDPGRFDNFESGLTASVNLYNGGRDYWARRMAENELEMSRLDRRGVDNALVAGVIQAYYNVLAAGEFVEIAAQSVATVASQLKVMRVRYDAGGVLKSDILSLEVRLGQAREDEIHHRNRLEISLTALATLMGVDPETPLRLKKNDRSPIPLPDAYPEGLKSAMDRRPELLKARRQVVQSGMAVEAAAAGYLPRVDLTGRYYLDDADLEYDTDRENWQAAVMVHWNLFDGFATRAEVNAAEAALEEMLALDRKTVLTVRNDVRTAYLKLAEARARLEVARKNVDSAEESLKIVKRQYEGGSATITRYLEAELDRNHSRTRAAAAFYNRETALAEAARAIGYWAVNAADYRKETTP